MARRSKKDEEIAFGSDSFLDVIANIVGILIILIVIVGVRVKNAPSLELLRKQDEVKSAERAESERKIVWLEEKERIETENARRRQEREQSLALRAKEVDERLRTEEERRQQQEQADQELKDRLAAIERARELLKEYERQAAFLYREVSTLSSKLSEETERQAKREVERQAVERELISKESALRAAEQTAATEMEKVERLDLDWKTIARQVNELRKDLDKLQNLKAPVKQWVHYATPLSRRVQREEIHYRCLGGKVADTHLDELLAIMKRDFDIRDLDRQPVKSGLVGPVGGFRLSYMIQRGNISLADQLRDPGIYNVQLGGWQLSGDPELGESESAALTQGSTFLGSLDGRPPRVFSITLWVYSDSFPLVKALQGYLHERGYTVALRPLPMGVPIAASPKGTASRGQ